ncbi:MAG: DHHA1 domain-containing protein [Anaerolineales bacterium]|nr:DHHA1 domain-containing protein [Anaerolineales bacterium]
MSATKNGTGSLLLYLTDPLTLAFETNVTESLTLPDGRPAVLLEQSFFYPTGGGQEDDTGMIGPARVVEVTKQDNPLQVIHVLDRPVLPGAVHCTIDASRRQRHSQHHTAQHLLTQCFVHLFGLDTLSANINGYTPSTLDLPVPKVESEQLVQAENLANQIIFEDRPVQSYFVSPQELERLPLRRAPKVSEDIRIIEIEGFDYTPCGGTHCSRTGQIGVIKIVRTEKQNERTRVHFVAGWQALELFQASYATVSNLAIGLSVGQAELAISVLRQAEQLQKVLKDLQSYQAERLAWEASRLAENATRICGRMVSLAVFNDRPAVELRLLAGELSKKDGLVSILASTANDKLSLVTACSSSVSLSARDLLARLLTIWSGRGGGDARLAQGGGTLQPGQNVETLLREELETGL